MDLEKVYARLKFLVVDDFENFRASLRQMLGEFGAVDISVAASGIDAVDKCRFNRFDVVLCDYNMGAGKNGQQILEELRYKKYLRRTALFVLVTAETGKDIVMGAREQEPDGYIAKPLTKAVLEKRLNSLLEQRQVLLPINTEIDNENYPKAITLCDAEIRRRRKYTSWCYKTIGELYFRTGDYSHARKIYEDLLVRRPIPWAQLGLARVRVAQQNFGQAISCYHELIENYPDMVEAYDGLAEAYRQTGNLEEAKIHLERAVQRSPLAILRQEKLGDLCIQTHDLEDAARAYKSTVKLGRHSCFESAEQYLKYGDTLCELSDGNKSESGKKYARDAVQALKTCHRRFNEDVEARARSLLIESRVHRGQGNKSASDKALLSARSLLEDEIPGAKVGLELAKTFYRLDKPEEAEKLLTGLAARYENDKAVMRQIEELLDEPVKLTSKLKARSFNRRGINAFEEGKLDEAIEIFEQALEIVPRHPALNLNLIQVLLKSSGTRFDPAERIRRCEQCLRNAGHIPPQHRQYKRYRFLLGKVQKMRAGPGDITPGISDTGQAGTAVIAGSDNACR
ncbi:MAG: hypothetical protein CSA52_01215 [Gammaproteobacteria bacterium]|nr:MAG: hypothetical protein CSB48_13125 [Pseudomonadota bacterium]PIE38800.1 MAG: hypothetical protein CSA52_01215 [Gammaproteobacteria bacterium]